MFAAKAFSSTRAQHGLALAGLLCLAVASAWFAQHGKPAVRAYPDSGVYLEGARNLAAGQGYTTARVSLGESEPAAITAYAPGFSWLMVPFLWLGLELRESAGAVLGLSYVAYALFTYLLVLAATRPSWWPAAGIFSGVLILQPTVLQYVPSILSDLPFAVGTTAVLWLSIRWVRREDPSPFAALGIGVCLGLVTLIRWSGLHLAIVLVAGMMLALPAALPLGRRLRLCGWVAVGAIGSVAPWLLRNRIRGGFLTGDRFVTLHDPSTMASHALAGLTAGLADTHALLARFPAATIAYDVSLAAAACLLAIVLIRARAWRVRHARLLAIVAGGYVALLVGTAVIHIIDALIAPRYWLPVWPVLGALALGALAHADLSRPLRAAVLVGLAVPAFVSGVVFNAHRVHLARPDVQVETYFLAESLARSAPVAYVRSKGRDCTIASNFALLLTLHARPRLVYPLPTSADALRALLDSAERVCIAYFHRRDLYRTRPELDPRGALATLAQEGRIRRIQRDGVGEIWVAEPDAG